jgi:hypothetical protein
MCSLLNLLSPECCPEPRLFGRDGSVCFEFSTLPQGFLWQVLLASLCCEH